MKDLFENNKKVMIVKGKLEEARYAQLLFSMISKMSDVESSQPITEDEYKKSYVTVENTPKEKIIFFGNDKEAKEQGKAVVWQYDRFGMKYGWLGKRCVIKADSNKITSKEQSEFTNHYNKRIKEFQSLSSTLNLRLRPQASIAKKDLWERQYELLVCEFMANGFKAFMDNISDCADKGHAIIVYDTKDVEYAHLLHNLIQQYTGYDAAEFTEKMFLNNAKDFASNNKIIFLGKTKASKERWLDSYRYVFYENGMRYGWVGNEAFVCIKQLKKSEVGEFIKVYELKSKTYKDKAKDYLKPKDSKIGISGAIALSVIFPGLSLPVMLGNILTRFIVGKTVDQKIDDMKTTADLMGYQYQLLLREFVFNGFTKFMEA